MTLRFLLAAPLLLAACSDIPKDPEGTLERVRAERSFRVGLIASAAPIQGGRQQAMIDRVGRATGARPIYKVGAAEPLLAQLEEGKLDLVIGELSPSTPWAKQVSILPLLGEDVTFEGHVHLAAVARNGENAWITLLHRQARDVAALP